MKIFILSLTKNFDNQVLTDFENFGCEITWVSKSAPSIVTVETDKSKEELEQFFLVETATEDSKGDFYY